MLASSHLIASETFSRYIQTIVTGATVPHISQSQIAAYQCRIPPLNDQDRICEVLDAIDDLIENNRRRIELMEQIAQDIYREWFVRFRYPGHDGTFVDSSLGLIPHGWDVVSIGKVLELRYGKALKASDRRGGRVAVVGSSGVIGWHAEEFVPGPVIVVGRKGNVGNVIRIPGPCWPIDTTFYVSTELPLNYVAEQLKQASFINSHAAVPGLSRDQANSLPFLLPPANVMAAFSEISAALGFQGETLHQQTDLLAQTRDFLLPGLVTGRIDVSDLNLDALMESVG